MFELKKLNVHLLVETEEEKAALISKGFEEVVLVAEEVKEVDPGKV